ncbi:MAG: pyridoxamine 5'-phosphate oxidase family protein [Actinomycetota bacterium]
MVTWDSFETLAPELAVFGRERIDRRVSFLATIRDDGGPRVHPVTPWIADGHLYVRMYETSPKVADLERDPRFALHSMMDNADGIGGEFAMRGRATGIHDRDTVSAAYAAIGGPGSDRPLVLFELGVDDVVTTRYSGDETERRRWPARGTS